MTWKSEHDLPPEKDSRCFQESVEQVEPIRAALGPDCSSPIPLIRQSPRMSTLRLIQVTSGMTSSNELTADSLD